MGFIIWGISKRFRKAFIYLWPVYYFLFNTIAMICYDSDLLKDSMIQGGWTVKTHSMLQFNALLWYSQYLIMLVFFSPSLGFSVFVYAPIFVVTRLYLLTSKYDLSDFELNNVVISENFLCVLTASLVFYSLQMREVKRFFQQTVAVEKEKQVTTVLDSQSDGIIVVH